MERIGTAELDDECSRGALRQVQAEGPSMLVTTRSRMVTVEVAGCHGAAGAGVVEAEGSRTIFETAVEAGQQYVGLTIGLGRVGIGAAHGTGHGRDIQPAIVVVVEEQASEGHVVEDVERLGPKGGGGVGELSAAEVLEQHARTRLGDVEIRESVAVHIAH